MYRFFEPVIQPLLEAARAEVVVEIGSDLGYGTEKLAGWCRQSGAVVHSIDPAPKFDEAEYRERFGTSLILHRHLSLNAIPTLPPPDVVLIDGDHNWFTVFHELREIDELVRREGADFPLVVLHDVGWPYGRRDLYYDPSAVPEKDRHPYRRGGLTPTRREPGPDGLNRHLNNAVYEGTARNGVLTAVEDFVAGSERQLRLRAIPGIHGLGVLWDPGVATPQLTAALGEVFSADGLRSVLNVVEGDRLDQLVRLADRTADRDAYRERAETLERRLEQAEEGLGKARAVKQQLIEAQRQADRHARLVRLLRQREELLRQQQASRDKEHKDKIAALHQETRRLRSERRKARERLQVAERELSRLRGRRSVRLALGLARTMRPVFAAWRRVVRRRPTVTSAPIPTASESPPPTVAPPAAEADIIVCVHNALEDVRACLESIVEHTNLSRHRLILVDDGSDAPTRDHLRAFAADHGVLLNRSETASGYARAANRGMRVATAPYVVLLNSDVVVTDGWLESMLQCARSDDAVGIVGPLSNAASWQTIPELFEEDGSWKVNELPSGTTADEVAQRLRLRGSQLYPAVALVNGFCQLIRRALLDEVGLFDEESFPYGYGEEDDLCLRAAAAGYHHRIADDTYVYHAKSRSYSSERRVEIVKTSKERLRAKHGPDVIAAAVEDVRYGADLVRARTAATMAIAGHDDGSRKVDLTGLRLAWVQPHLNTVGGIRRAVEITNRLVGWGAAVDLVTPTGEQATWLPIRGQVVDQVDALARSYDVLVLSDPDCLWGLELAHEHLVVYHLAGYSLYRPFDAQLERYYTLEGNLELANSGWTAEQVRDLTGREIALIIPGGVDQQTFRPVRAERTHDIVCYGSSRPHKGTATIEAAAGDDLTLLRLSDEGLSQRELAHGLARGRVFVSAAWHEGFNLLPLEAMACGVPVVMTDDGGSREYARDGHNALVVPPMDDVALRAAVDKVRSSPELRAQLIESGIRTAWRYTWDRAAEAFADAVHTRLPTRGNGGG